ncbi:MAG: YfhO family protein [Candidatus Levybacteria bacterium]|nr:YfhO family protein [Candidatus Levybacteria bacterium]
MEKIIKNRGALFFLFLISFLTFIIFRPVFLQNKIPFNANLLASFYNPWAQEKFPGWEVGIPNKPVGKDDIWIFYPQRTFTNSVLKNGEIPFWNPYSFSGNYHLGLSETAVFYPLNFLFFLPAGRQGVFPQIDVWTFLILIEFIIAGAGMYLFLKRIVRYEKSAVFGALAFAFSGIVIVRSIEGLSVGHSLIWMPYVFWGIESFFQTKKIRFLWLILVFLSFSLLAGWFQYTFYIFVFSLVYSVIKLYWIKDRTKFYFLILTPFLILPLISLFHTTAAFQTLLESPRSALEGGVFSFTHLMPILHTFTLIFPDFWGNPAVYNYFGKSEYKESMMFIGVIPLVFSLISIFKQKKKEEAFFLGAIIVSFILAIDNLFSRWLVSSALPVFSSFLPNRIFLVSTFSFCVLSAFGLDYLLSGKNEAIKRTIKKTFIFLWLSATILILFVAFEVSKNPAVLDKEIIQIRTSIIPLAFIFITSATFFVFRKKYSKNIFFIVLVGILFFQSYIFSAKYIPFSYREFLYPEHPVFSYLDKHQGLDRFMSVGYGHVVPSIPLQFGLYSPEGIGSMYIRRYGEFVRYMKLGDYGIPDKIAYDQEIYPKDVFYPKDERLHRFYELTSVKYIVSDNKSMNEAGVVPDKNVFPMLWENDKWLVFQYKKSMPRFFITSNFKVIKDDKEILNSLFGKDFAPNKIILEEDPGFEPKESSGNAKIIDYSPNKISARVSAGNDSLFYLSDNYSKMFKVFIDGKEGKMLRANYTFRAVPIPAGEHMIEMKYDDRPFVLGIKIAILTLSTLGIFTYIFRKYV